MEVAFFVLTGLVFAGCIACVVVGMFTDNEAGFAAAFVLAIVFAAMAIGCWNLAAHQACGNREVCDLR